MITTDVRVRLDKPTSIQVCLNAGTDGVPRAGVGIASMESGPETVVLFYGSLAEHLALLDEWRDELYAAFADHFTTGNAA